MPLLPLLTDGVRLGRVDARVGSVDRLLLAEQLELVQLLDDEEQLCLGLERQPLLRQLEHQLPGAILREQGNRDLAGLEVATTLCR